MRAFAITGMVTACWMPRILSGSAMRATPPSRRMSAGTRSSAMTATAPASSATFAWSAVTTSMMTPPFSISAKPVLTLSVPISSMAEILPSALEAAGDRALLVAARGGVPDEHEVLVALEHLVDRDPPAGEVPVGLLDPGSLGVVLAEGHD